MTKEQRRMMLLDPSNSATVKIETYMFSLVQKPTDTRLFDQESKPQITIRPSMLITNVEQRDELVIRQITIQGQTQLLEERDAYEYTYKYRDEILESLRKDRKLPTIAALIEYYDERDWDLPNPMRIMLPTLIGSRDGGIAATTMRVTGEFRSNAIADRMYVVTFSGPGISNG